MERFSALAWWIDLQVVLSLVCIEVVPIAQVSVAIAGGRSPHQFQENIKKSDSSPNHLA
jgi:hypothetical protein